MLPDLFLHLAVRVPEAGGQMPSWVSCGPFSSCCYDTSSTTSRTLADDCSVLTTLLSACASNIKAPLEQAGGLAYDLQFRMKEA